MKEWTFMIYMAGDNNLSDDMISSIDAIKTGVLNSIKPGGIPSTMTGLNNVAFLVEYDGSHPCVATYQIDLTYESVNYDPWRTMQPIPADDEKRSAEEKIKIFIEWSVRKHPAKNYALVVSGHSDGFAGRTLLFSDNDQSVASLAKLSEQIGTAIRELKSSEPNFNKDKLDLICFDSCLMNSMEVMYEFKDVANYWIGSQGSIPNYTWNYLGIAQQLVKLPKPQATIDKIIEIILEQTKIYNDTFAFQGRSIDMSAAMLDKIGPPAVYLSFLSIALLDISSNKYPRWLSDYWSRILSEAHVRCQTFMCEQSVDLLDYCDCISDACAKAKKEINTINPAGPPPVVKKFVAELSALQALIRSLKNAVGKMIKGQMHSGGDYRYAKGVSVFRPWSFIAFSMSLPNYLKLNFLDSPAGIAWTAFNFIRLMKDARPPLNIDIPLPPFVSKVQYDRFTTAKKKVIPNELSALSQNEKVSVLILSWINQFLAENGFGDGVRDNPPHSKGMDAYLDYFRTVKNFWPPIEK